MGAHILNNETYKAAKKEIWKVTIILSVLTIVELVLGFIMMKNADLSPFIHTLIKGSILILMVVKAFYIVSYFMHLGHEVRNFVLTIVTPLFLFIWFITAFLKEGSSYNNLKNTYNRQYNEQSKVKVQPKEHGAAQHGAEAHH